MELTRIDGITDTNKLRGIMANAKGVSDEHYFRSFKRLLTVTGEKYEDKIEKAFHNFLVAYEVFLKEDNNGENRKATRTRQAVTNKGIKKTIEGLVTSRTPSRGFMRLMEYNMPELTLEHLVIENSDEFSDKVVESALEKMVEYA